MKFKNANQHKCISFTAIFDAMSGNYTQGFGNGLELKKLIKQDGLAYTYISRQCLGAEVKAKGKETFNWKDNTLTSQNSVIQFDSQFTIKDSVEMDLFGYMMTKAKDTKKSKKGKKGTETAEAEETVKSEAETSDMGETGSLKRVAPLRLSNAFSLTPYYNDTEFQTNGAFAARLNANANPINVEQHQSLYAYTVTIDLERVGIDGSIELDAEERATRVCEALEIFKILTRTIRGRVENLAPVFVIGGLYSVYNPFFEGRIALRKGTSDINTDLIKDVLNNEYLGYKVAQDTVLGKNNHYFTNDTEMAETFKDITMGSVSDFFNDLQNKVTEYYGVTLS